MASAHALDIDLLSEILDLPHIHVGAFGPISAGGAWALTSITGNDVAFCAVTRGSCWYVADGMDRPVAVGAGDVVVLSYQTLVTWASSPEMIAGAPTSYAPADDDGVVRLGQGNDFHMLGGGFRISAERERLFRITLPRVIHLRGTQPEAEPLAWLVGQLIREMTPQAQPGRSTMLAALAQMLFTQSLRAHLANVPEGEAGWLSVFGDGRLLDVLTRMHADPAYRWNLAELAKIAGMSRTVFAERFREALGMPPLTYLANWRMRVAMDLLRAGSSVNEAAEAAGYGSERAFNAAFVRMTETTPGAYRRAAKRARELERATLQSGLRRELAL
jgi:AraC-like DNA-binding protein